MEENEIELLSKSSNITEISNVLQRFLANNENKFSFPSLCYENRRVLVWTAVFQLLQKQQYCSVHPLCLATVRILSRDKMSLEELLCERWILILIEKSGLYGSDVTELQDKEVALEALKCLCNLTFNSPTARAHCANTDITQGLVDRLHIYKDIPYKYDIMLYDMKLLFILTAFRQDIKFKIANELDGMSHLINCLNDILLDSMNPNSEQASSKIDTFEGKQFVLSDQKQEIVCEILKSQFNLNVNNGLDESVSSKQSEMYLNLMPVLIALLRAQTSDEDKLMELHSNVANLLISVPASYYIHLTPELAKDETSIYAFNDRDMHALHILFNLLQHQLSIPVGVKSLYENLSPILTVLNKSARSCRIHRKYLRQQVLPPLRDVSNPPERGDTMRNQLCRLLTTHVTSVRDLVAEFLFILCKENVGRMVKYTGFGNAAGHLAQKGLLDARPGSPYSSSSDSDTEEYLEAAPRIDPVVGCTRPPRVNPFEGMSEEQKEYEAMRLVNLFDKMVSSGAVKPARVGPDGRPQAIEHVLQLRKD